MPGSSNTSFIPKRNPAMGERRNSRRQVYVGTFIVRILFIASLLATAGVFIYDYKLNKNLDSEIVALNAAIGTFNEAEMQRVQATDLRLSQANKRLDYSASIVSLLSAVEASVVGSIQLTELSLNRISDEVFEVETQIKATSFDSVLFQRRILDDNRTMAFSEIKELVLQNVPPNNSDFADQLETQKADDFAISFQALLNVDRENIPHTIAPIVDTTTPVVTEVEETIIGDELNPEEGEETEVFDDSNQEQI